MILTDTLMFLLFTFASVAALVFLVRELGGVPVIVEKLVAVEQKPDLMSWHGIIGPGTAWPTAMDYVIWAIVIDISWMLVYMVSPWQSSRHQIAKNEHVVVRSAHEISHRRTRTTIVAPVVLLFVNGVLSPVLLTMYYVLPYQRATGTLRPDGSLDWLTGEMALMVSWSIIWINVGVFAIRYIRKAYSPSSMRGESRNGVPAE